jgi:hypothetical protein
MSEGLFEKNPYTILGVAHDTPSNALVKAFAEAKKARRAKDQEINVANKELMQVGSRLVLDALTLAPDVPDAVLDQVSSGQGGFIAPRTIDLATTLMIVPDVVLSFVGKEPPRLSLREDLLAQDTVLTPEIER